MSFEPLLADHPAEQLNALLTRLATTPPSALPRQAATHWRDFADAVVAELHPLMSQDGRARAETELAALRALPALDTAVVHGDLGGENLLWEWHAGLPVLTGVIDWDEVALGDQAEDLAALSASYGPELLAALKRVEARGANETAHRTKDKCGQVFRYAIAHGLATRDPAADLRGALAPIVRTSRAAITDPSKVGALLRALEGYAGQHVTRTD